MPGEVLSGYECLQPFTIENGYKTAAAYENGQVVDSIGGGVCQIATTLYDAALQAEMEIVQRQNHSMIVTYVKPSMDAAIAGTYKDIKIKNNYSTPVYIEGYTSGKKLISVSYTHLWEDLKRFKQSFNDVYSMEPEQLQLGFLKILKGSYMEELILECDLLYSAAPPYEVLQTKWLSYGDVLELKDIEEMTEVHYNSRPVSYTHLL